MTATTCVDGADFRVATCASLLVQLPARVQIIEIHDRVEDEEVTAFGLAAPDRVI